MNLEGIYQFEFSCHLLSCIDIRWQGKERNHSRIFVSLFTNLKMILWKNGTLSKLIKKLNLYIIQ